MMMMTAGTVPVKDISCRCWCCGTSSNSNSKRMGGIVFATDVRMASKEQVESLGEKFLTIRGC